MDQARFPDFNHPIRPRRGWRLPDRLTPCYRSRPGLTDPGLAWEPTQVISGGHGARGWAKATRAGPNTFSTYHPPPDRQAGRPLPFSHSGGICHASTTFSQAHPAQRAGRLHPALPACPLPAWTLFVPPLKRRRRLDPGGVTTCAWTAAWGLGNTSEEEKLPTSGAIARYIPARSSHGTHACPPLPLPCHGSWPL